MNIDDAYKVIPDQLKADLTLVNFGKMIADLPFYNGVGYYSRRLQESDKHSIIWCGRRYIIQ